MAEQEGNFTIRRAGGYEQGCHGDEDHSTCHPEGFQVFHVWDNTDPADPGQVEVRVYDPENSAMTGSTQQTLFWWPSTYGEPLRGCWSGSRMHPTSNAKQRSGSRTAKP